jgi:hypothetical protein
MGEVLMQGDEYGDFLNAEGAKVSQRAQKRNTKKYQKKKTIRIQI